MNKFNHTYNACSIRKIFFLLDQCTRNYSVVYNESENFELWSMLSADVNGDSRPDIIASFMSTYPNGVDASLGMLNILFNNGDNTFTTQTIFNYDIFVPVSVAAADVNGDNKLDIILLKKIYLKSMFFSIMTTALLLNTELSLTVLFHLL